MKLKSCKKFQIKNISDDCCDDCITKFFKSSTNNKKKSEPAGHEPAGHEPAGHKIWEKLVDSHLKYKNIFRRDKDIEYSYASCNYTIFYEHRELIKQKYTFQY